MSADPPSDEHTIVTATRAVVGAVRADGTLHEGRLAEVAQHAVDDVLSLARQELQDQPFDARQVIVDVRATAFMPAHPEGTEQP